jgi:hypothetical protein
MPFPKGVSGNPGGRPKTKMFADALRLQLLAPADDPRELPKKARLLDQIAHALVQEATSGLNRTQAIKEIRDMLDGRPAQAIEHSGNVGLTHEERIAQLLDPTHDTDGEDLSLRMSGSVSHWG